MSFVELDKADKLEKFCRALHGIDMGCPTCGARGKLDIETPAGKEPAFKKSIWWNSNTECWECYDCWLK